MESDKSMWDYFERIGEKDDKKAKCTLCDNVYCYKSTSHNLKAHLLRQHYNEIDDLSVLLTTSKPKPVKRGAPSLLWNYFTKCGDGQGSCNLCKNVLSYKSTSTNLKTHLKHKHPAEFQKFEEEQTDRVDNEIYYLQCDEDSDDSKSNVQPTTNAWSYFERETGCRVKCAICRSSLPENIVTMKKHLEEKHPKLIRGISPASQSDQESDDKQNEELYTEVVYLDDIGKDIEKETKINHKKEVNKRKVQKRRDTVEKRKRRSSSSSDEYFLKRKIVKEEEGEVENFGKYVTSLLKSMPQDVCTKLQMDIINLIINAKLNIKKKDVQNVKESVLRNKVVLDGVPVTLQAVGTVPQTDYMLAVPNTLGDSKQSIVTTLTLHGKNRIEHESTDAETETLTNITVETPSMRENGDETVPSPSSYAEHGYSFTIAPLNTEKNDNNQSD